MPIYPTLRAAFVHIPKTGGSTVTTLLKRDNFFGPKRNKVCASEHEGSDIFQVLEILGDEADEYFKFGFVRNPWDRFVSAFHYVKQRRTELTSVSSSDTFSEFVAEFASKPEQFLTIRYFQPQWPYLCDESGKSHADFVGKFERFDEELQFALSKIGVRRTLMRHRKQTKRSDYREYYDANSREAIADIYSNDVEFFGYNFDDGAQRKRSFFLQFLKKGN